MNNFEPTILGVLVFAMSVAEINDVLQVVLLVMTIVYTGYKILELIDKRKNDLLRKKCKKKIIMVRMFKWLAGKFSQFNGWFISKWNKLMGKLKIK